MPKERKILHSYLFTISSPLPYHSLSLGINTAHGSCYIHQGFLENFFIENVTRVRALINCHVDNQYGDTPSIFSMLQTKERKTNRQTNFHLPFLPHLNEAMNRRRKQAPRVTDAGKYINRAGTCKPFPFYSSSYPTTIWCRRKHQSCCFLRWKLCRTDSFSTLILALFPLTIYYSLISLCFKSDLLLRQPHSYSATLNGLRIGTMVKTHLCLRQKTQVHKGAFQGSGELDPKGKGASPCSSIDFRTKQFLAK